MQCFVAFGSHDKLHASAIQRAAEDASSVDLTYTAWTNQDSSGSPLAQSIEDWIDEKEAVVGDITYINDNVSFEIGYAIGRKKNVRLIRNKSIETSELKKIGLFDGLLWNDFITSTDLTHLLKEKVPKENKWPQIQKNINQPIYILQPPEAGTEFTKITSSVKKITRYKFRSFKSWEIARLSAQEAWEQVTASYGTVVTWQEGTSIEVKANNQRAAFIFGLSRGLGIPCILLAQRGIRIPSDLETKEIRWTTPADFENIFYSFRNEVQDAINETQQVNEHPQSGLSSLNCGDPAAENEQDQLNLYFLETEEFKKALHGETNIIIGRKGCGKSAIFLQVRDRVRLDKRNIVVDLSPEGYQLIKLKEMICKIQSLGVRNQFIAAFWQYVLWLEIAYKILEKDEKISKRDSNVSEKYYQLKKYFDDRVDTGSGDFSERLRKLTDSIENRFQKSIGNSSEIFISSKILEIVYGADISNLKGQVLSYLKTKGEIRFLFDNLDRMRSPSGFDENDAILILGLIESMQDISKQFKRNGFEFYWILFIRGDVYEFVVRNMPDYSKHATQSLEWGDPAILKRVLQERVLASSPDNSKDWTKIWLPISVQHVAGRDTMDFLVTASIMRPRYLIKMFESAKRRAINLGHTAIQEEDYQAALEEIGWTIMEDLNLELRDIVSDADGLLFDIAQLSGACDIPELKNAIAYRVGETDRVERVIDVLLWSGAIGINIAIHPQYIYNCGYKLQFMRSLIERNPYAEVCLHPTLDSLMKKINLSNNSIASNY
jgi:hypothetical protein